MPVLTFSNLSVCGGGNHAQINVNIGNKTWTVRVTKDAILEPVTDADLEALAMIILRHRISVMNEPTPQQMAAAILSTTVTFQ